ncbi:MAG: helix-turn-helix domain-containing protein [Pseudomonadota bacterium]
MTRAGIPERVLNFIESAIDTVPELEALLLLREHDSRWWSDEDVAARTYVSRKEASRILETLRRRGLIVLEADPAKYRYAPGNPDTTRLMAEVASAYQHHLMPIANLIHQKSSASVREFARAFDLKKDK